MKTLFIFKENKKLIEVLNTSYKPFLAALKQLRADAQELIEDDAIAQAHDAYALIKLGQIKISEIETIKDRYIALEILINEISKK